MSERKTSWSSRFRRPSKEKVEIPDPSPEESQKDDPIEPSDQNETLKDEEKKGMFVSMKERAKKMQQAIDVKLHQTERQLTKKASEVGTSLKYSLISKDTEEAFNDVWELMKEQFEDVEVSKVNMVTGFILLSTYYRSHHLRTEKYVTENKEFVSEALYYMKIASSAYGWKLLYGLGSKNSQKPLAISKGYQMGNRANIEACCKHTELSSEDFIEQQWTSDLFDNGHFVAYDTSRKNVVVSLRGTFHVRDAMVDLTGKNREFLNGLAHDGMMKVATKKFEKLEPIIAHELEARNLNSVRIVGHSLGAGTAALLGMQLMKKHPDWDVKCYCYGTPCIVSKNLSEEFEDRILSFTLQDDVITRMSLGSLEALKNAIIQLLSQSNNNFERVYHIINAGNNFGENASQKFENWMRVKSKINFEEIDRSISKHEKLVPPGKIYHLYKKVGAANYSMEESKREFFTEVILSSTMYTDHMPLAYEAAIQSVLENEGESFVSSPEETKEVDVEIEKLQVKDEKGNMNQEVLIDVDF